MTEAKGRGDQSVSKRGHTEGKFLTFSLNGEEYGIAILKVREIMGMMKITTVPQVPAYIKGVINLRGKVIPIMDLRLRFCMESVEHTDRTCIIVVEMGGGSKSHQIGIVVDAVSEVLSIKGSDIEDVPSFSTGVKTDFILGMAKMGEGVKILLDIDRVLAAGEISLLAEAA